MMSGKLLRMPYHPEHKIIEIGDYSELTTHSYLISSKLNPRFVRANAKRTEHKGSTVQIQDNAKPLTTDNASAIPPE